MDIIASGNFGTVTIGCHMLDVKAWEVRRKREAKIVRKRIRDPGVKYLGTTGSDVVIDELVVIDEYTGGIDEIIHLDNRRKLTADRMMAAQRAYRKRMKFLKC